MCAIVDANVVGEVFGDNRSPAGQEFNNWLRTRGGRLAVGGKLKNELYNSSKCFREWAKERIQSGRIRQVNDKIVEDRTLQLQNGSQYRSNDTHVLALAQVSGSRLLYSNDRDLQLDFKNKTLINNPRGKVYSTKQSKKFTQQRKNQLSATAKRCKFNQ